MGEKAGGGNLEYFMGINWFGGISEVEGQSMGEGQRRGVGRLSVAGCVWQVGKEG